MNYIFQLAIVSFIFLTIRKSAECEVFSSAKNFFLFRSKKFIIFEEKMKKNDVTIKVIEGSNMPHIWPFLPVMKEAKTSLNKIIEIINM